ncbi:Ros/MucR family transcriptional regulator [Sphingobium baderi]|uniref:MucR family transcriptional regulator n=1 Tax=Sphingobium baderi TaxID=1332080 RepID=UPI002B40B24D|nr:MucR family transcriptional regulator [Sphingobium baderi]WRD78863.1 MucR family transcriptional regulator [Sphingobium baderi]
MTGIEEDKDSLVSLTASIVSANVSNNPMAVEDLCGMIKSVHFALSGLSTPEAAPISRREPAVPIRSSVKEDYIVCLEDGKKLKTLKRYLRARYQMSPEEYRAKWGLPADYPMAAPSYTNQRRELAHKIGLGRRPKAAAAKRPSRPKSVLAVPAELVSEKPKRARSRGRVDGSANM